MAYREISAGSNIQEKVDWAHTCFKKHKKTLLDDIKVNQLLENFNKAASESFKEMIETGLVEECRKCEEEEGGACCGAGIENRYSGTLLLINLLMGVALPSKQEDKRSCFFLGKRGCMLKARHVICVNYICKKITDNISEEAINHLRNLEGLELEILFILNERIKAILRELK